jgi:hypothetical protein
VGNCVHVSLYFVGATRPLVRPRQRRSRWTVPMDAAIAMPGSAAWSPQLRPGPQRSGCPGRHGHAAGPRTPRGSGRRRLLSEPGPASLGEGSRWRPAHRGRTPGRTGLRRPGSWCRRASSGAGRRRRHSEVDRLALGAAGDTTGDATAAGGGLDDLIKYGLEAQLDRVQTGCVLPPRPGIRCMAPPSASTRVPAVGQQQRLGRHDAPGQSTGGVDGSGAQKDGWSLKSPPRSACRSRP